MKLAKTPAEEGPFPVRKVRAALAWLAYWGLTGLDSMLRRVHSLVWQARHHLGWVMSDRPCPRCQKSMWRGREGCGCLLVTPSQFGLRVPRRATALELIGGDDAFEISFHPRTRRELFHWGRGHEFFSGGCRDALLHDDRAYRDMSAAEKDRWDELARKT